MKIKLNLSILLSIIMLFACILLSSLSGQSMNSPETTSLQTINNNTDIETEEMRGLWVSFITLDMTDTDMSFDSFKSKFDIITEKAIEYKLNTLIVQVRPFCDALYKSDIFPFSHILTGTQGTSPDYDPLDYMCEKAHNMGLKIHAWINPYRVATKTTPKELSKENPYVKSSTMGIVLDSGIYLNPAKKAARKLVVDGVAEIARNYPVDGIQFDDYFYPSDINDADSADYNTYKKSMGNHTPLTLDEWRIQNVNILISEIYNKVKSINKDLVFGISPQGNIENNKGLYADIKSWSEINGYVDYICPQMYYSIENPTLKFEDSLKEWKKYNYHSDIKVYIGLGAYKAGTDADRGTWLDKNNVLSNELKLLRKYKYNGFMIYDYSAFESKAAEAELKNLLSSIN